MPARKPSTYPVPGAIAPPQPGPADGDFIDRFKAHLRAEGLPLTVQREQIARAAFSIEDHFSVEDLSRTLRKRQHRIGLATVYRTIGLMVTGRIVRRHDFGDGFKVYERVVGRNHHDHLICEGCGRLIEFEAPDIEQIQERVANRQRFRARSHRLEIYGLCRECSREWGNE